MQRTIGIRAPRASDALATAGLALLAVLGNVASLPLFYGVGIAAIVLSDRPKRLGDRVGGTLVVRT